MNNFKKCRESKNLTVNEVCKKLGISKTALYSIESSIRNPSVHILRQLVELYNVSTDYLLGRTKFEGFTEQYEYLQNLDESDLCKELDSLKIDKWLAGDGTVYSKLNGEWFITIKPI